MTVVTKVLSIMQSEQLQKFYFLQSLPQLSVMTTTLHPQMMTHRRPPLPPHHPLPHPSLALLAWMIFLPLLMKILKFLIQSHLRYQRIPPLNCFPPVQQQYKVNKDRVCQSDWYNDLQCSGCPFVTLLKVITNSPGQAKQVNAQNA